MYEDGGYSFKQNEWDVFWIGEIRTEIKKMRERREREQGMWISSKRTFQEVENSRSKFLMLR